MFNLVRLDYAFVEYSMDSSGAKPKMFCELSHSPRIASVGGFLACQAKNTHSLIRGYCVWLATPGTISQAFKTHLEKSLAPLQTGIHMNPHFPTNGTQRVAVALLGLPMSMSMSVA
jgi:hypothetical protein